MPWCPVCKEEYKEGITICPECKAELVASLEETENTDFQDLINFADGKLAKKFTEYLQYSNIKAKYYESKNDGTYIISVHKKDLTKAKKHFNAFYSVEASNAVSRNLDGYHGAKEIAQDEVDEDLSWDRDESSEEAEDSIEVETTPSAASVLRPTNEAYVSMSEKKSDLFSTLVVFTIFGVAGLVVLFLEIFGITDFMNQMMFIMAIAVFCVGIPIVMITTYKSYKKVLGLEKEEIELTASLNDWMEKTFTKEAVHRLLYSIRVNAPSMPEEQLYLFLNQAMKKRVTDQFGDLDEAYLDYLVDTFYDSHFAEDTDSLEEDL